MRSRSLRMACLLASLLWLHPDLVARGEGPVRMGVLTNENWDQLAPKGKEVDAILGDIVIRNDYLIAVIAQPTATRHANMTVRDVGGCLIDLTSTEYESDQLSCYYPGLRTYPYRSWKGVTLSMDERELEIELELDGTVHEADVIGVSLVAEGSPTRARATVTYSMGQSSRSLAVLSQYHNVGRDPITVTMQDDVRADGGKEEMRKSENGQHKTFWFQDHFWKQAYVIWGEMGSKQSKSGPDYSIQSTSDSRTTTLKFPDEDGNSTVKLAYAQVAVISRYIAPGRTLLHARANLAQLTSSKTKFVDTTVTVVDSAGQPVADAVVTLGDAHLRTDVKGLTQFPIESGEYKVDVTVHGIKLLDAAVLTIPDGEKSQQTLTLKGYQPGTVVAAVTNGDGEPIPCKVEFIPVGSTPLPNFGPETAEFAVKNLRYTVDGTFTQSLHPGEYDCLVSHGPEHEIAMVRINVESGKTVSLTANLTRSVDTTGWVSADYHSHSSPSGDNTGSQLGRVINLVCEQLDFAPCTEHNRISTYADHIAKLKIEAFMASCSGMELTGSPLPLNHQNTFPLIMHPREQDGGGPVTDGDPEQQIARLALWDDRSEKFLQQNHPDLGWLYFDKNGDGIPDEGFSRSFDFMDAIEVHPIDSAWQLTTDNISTGNPSGDRILNWLQLLNLGHRAAGVVNTDAHYNFHGSGGLRNWVKSPTDDPRKIQIIDMVHASEEGHLVMSNGPFLEVSTTSGDKAYGPGDDLAAADGKVSLKIRVQSPKHIAVDEVFILVNGKHVPSLHYTRATHPEKFGNSTVDFDQTVPVTLTGDSHLVVVAGSRTATLGAAFGPAWGKQHPTAMTNPLFVDVDGNGFKPNKDTLGLPLPVKGGIPKGK
ncbi:MAG: CehA/McbA family metallohydrolase [Planctomycetaceae bacterium]